MSVASVVPIEAITPTVTADLLTVIVQEYGPLGAILFLFHRRLEKLERKIESHATRNEDYYSRGEVDTET